MSTLRTDLGTTRESARRLRFEPTTLITATNVQKAIEQASAAAGTGTPTSVTTTPYTVLPSDTVLLVNVAGAAVVTLQTAAARAGVDLVVKDISGAASTNNITITPTGGDTIDGAATLVIRADYGGYNLGVRTGAYYVKP